MKNKLSLFILLGLLTAHFGPLKAAAPACEFLAEKISDPACAELLLKIEYVIADLASATYELIALQTEYQHHPHLEFSKKQRAMINALDTFLYKNGNYEQLTRTFKFKKQEGIDAALTFFKKVADLIDVSLPSHTDLASNEQKYNWLKQAVTLLKKAYKKMKPVLKSDELSKSLKRAIIFNPVTRHIPLAELAQALSSEISTVIGTGITLYFKNKYKPVVADGASLPLAVPPKSLAATIFSRQNIESGFILLGIRGINQMLSQYLQSLAADKKKFEERERFAKMSDEQKKMKKQLHSMVSHAGTGEGFSTIREIQDDKTIKDLTFFADWLKHPISYAGNSLALMLYGEPGNGKGIITKALSNESKTPLITISAVDVAKRQIGQKLWAARQIAKDRDQKSIIVFFDEIDLIVPQKDTAALQAFLTFLDGTQQENPHIRILYIFATNHIEKLDPRMLRPGRFKSKVYVGPPNKAQRAKLIEMSLHSVFKSAPAELVEKLAEATDGLSRVAIDEAIENTYNHATLTEETPNLESFLEEIEKLKDVTYHSTKQVA